MMTRVTLKRRFMHLLFVPILADGFVVNQCAAYVTVFLGVVALFRH